MPEVKIGYLVRALGMNEATIRRRADAAAKGSANFPAPFRIDGAGHRMWNSAEVDAFAAELDGQREEQRHFQLASPVDVKAGG